MLLWSTQKNPNFWEQLATHDYIEFLNEIKYSIQSLYESTWRSCTRELRHAIILFTLSGIALPQDLQIENLTLFQLEDLLYITFEKKGDKYVMELPFIILSIFLFEDQSLLSYKYDWLKLPGYINGPEFEKVKFNF